MNELEKEFVPHEESLALKELGFDEPCLGFFIKKDTSNKGREGELVIKQLDTQKGNIVLAPLYQQVFRFFRKNYNLDSYVLPLEDRHNPCIIGYQFIIHVPSIHKGLWSTYEEAELECLRKLIEIVQNKK